MSIPRLTHPQSKFAERKADSIFEELNKNDKAYMEDRYNTSKLLEVFTVRELATAMQSGPHASQPVILNTLNPGLCHSELAREMDGFMGYFMVLLKFLLARTTEVGSRTLVASACAGDESHGQYMSESKVMQPSTFVRSEEGQHTQKRVWAELKEVLEKIQPGVTENI